MLFEAVLAPGSKITEASKPFEEAEVCLRLVPQA